MTLKIPDNADCLKMLVEFVHITVLKGDMVITPMVWRNDEEGKCVFSLLDLAPQAVPGLFYEVVNTSTQEPKCGYLCVALDMVSVPEQGLEFDDFVLVGEYDPTLAPSGAKTYRDRWRWGVINYDKANGIIREIDWSNSYWKEAGHRLLRQFGPPCFVWVKTKAPAAVAR